MKNKVIKFVLRLPVELHAILREKSYKENISINKIIIDILEKEFNND